METECRRNEYTAAGDFHHPPGEGGSQNHTYGCHRHNEAMACDVASAG